MDTQMNGNFQQSLKLVLRSEGGNSDDPLDHGGRTSRGVTQREYDAWCKERGLPQGDVWQASDYTIAQIYHAEYWLPYCDSLPIGTDYMYFDMSVNAGPYRATQLLQQALHLPDDGRWGPVTRAAVAKANPISLVGAYTNAKAAFYISLHQPRFLNGWLNRCRDVRTNALMMIKGGQ